jgi:hypothetical protein
MSPKLRFVVRVFTPLLYLASAAAVYAIAQVLSYIISIDRNTFEAFADTRGAVELLVGGVALAVFAAATVLLMKLESQPRPSIWDHLRQSVLWYAFGLSWWSATLEKSGTHTVTDTVIGLLPITAILATGLVIGLLRAQRRTA